MGFRVVFLPDCHLVLSLFKDRVVGAFLNQKKRGSQTRKNLLNNN